VTCNLQASTSLYKPQSEDGWTTLFDGETKDPVEAARRSIYQSGQSPGVSFKLPLHVVHELTLEASGSSPQLPAEAEGGGVGQEEEEGEGYRWVRLVMQRPSKNGWGVSLWQMSLYGRL